MNWKLDSLYFANQGAWEGLQVQGCWQDEGQGGTLQRFHHGAEEEGERWEGGEEEECEEGI